VEAVARLAGGIARGRRALPAGRLAARGATLAFRHGLLGSGMIAK
jgi:hypothetical protein